MYPASCHPLTDIQHLAECPRLDPVIPLQESIEEARTLPLLAEESTIRALAGHLGEALSGVGWSWRCERVRALYAFRFVPAKRMLSGSGSVPEKAGDMSSYILQLGCMKDLDTMPSQPVILLDKGVNPHFPYSLTAQRLLCRGHTT